MVKKNFDINIPSGTEQRICPVVAVLGHVDHGKTTLLDAIRKTNVVEKEKGGITQKIGAYQVEVETKSSSAKASSFVKTSEDKSGEKRKITFIDTPGHETFTKIRSRGASVTDIALLVVSAADGVQPQTKESIMHIKNAKIPYIVVLTKIDLPNAGEKKVLRQLADNGVLTEKNGGDVVAMSVSAKTGQGLKELLEMIILLSDMNGKKEENDNLRASIIESSLSKVKGPVATAIIKNGTLKIRDEIVVDNQKVKIRALLNDKGKNVEKAIAGDPVEILGFSQVPAAGAKIFHTGDTAIFQTQPETVTEDSSKETKALSEEEAVSMRFKVILKTDNASSLEAITLSLSNNIMVIYSAVGEINESDILMAKTSKSFVIGFNVAISKTAQLLAQRENVKIKIYQIIYELLDEIEEVAEAMLQGRLEEIFGRAKIIAEFPFDKKRVAGCKVEEGRLAKGDLVRLERNGENIGQTKIKSLREFKKEINKAEVGQECGCLFDSEIDFQLGDMILSIRR
ncbi:MAG: translation initiation factor IF-2 [Patescibacteria group bacterium]|nr:translation initiation factor IF-2 [Patescibacteria group bacterium]